MNLSALRIAPAAWLLASLAAFSCHAQAAAPARPDMAIDAKVRADVVEALARQIDANYVLPEVAAKAAAGLRERLRAGRYDALAGAQPFAEALSKDVAELTGDKHMLVGYSDDVFPRDKAPDAKPPAPDPAVIERMRAEERKENFGFEQYRRLAGNVAYLDLRYFSRPVVARDAALAALSMVASADALIVDLRGNGGGDGDMAAPCSATSPCT